MAAHEGDVLLRPGDECPSGMTMLKVAGRGSDPASFDQHWNVRIVGQSAPGVPVSVLQPDSTINTLFPCAPTGRTGGILFGPGRLSCAGKPLQTGIADNLPVS